MAKFHILLVIFALVLTIPYVASAAESMTMIQSGISGVITTKDIMLYDLNGDGSYEIVAGTSTGIYVFGYDGTLETYMQTASPVTNVVAIDDITGDGWKEVVVSTSDMYFPNIQCLDLMKKEKLWDFSPRIEVYDPYILWTMKQTSVFDMLSVDDVNGNGRKDLVTSAGYVIYAIDGETGEEIWHFQSTDNVWDIALIDGDIIAGDQNGYLYRIDADSGNEMWRKYVSKEYTVINPSTNSEVGDVKRSVWDILPIEVDGETLVTVSAEDGKAYMIDPSDGEVLWETEVIEYVNTLLYSYYGESPIPTPSTGYNFFNLRLTSVDDVTGDGNRDLLASTFPGTRTGNEYKGVQALYMLDSESGEIVWKNENVALGLTPGVDVVDIDGDYIAIPMGASSGEEKIRLIDPKDGTTFESLNINTTSRSGGVYYMKATGDGKFILTSSSGDLTLIEYPDETVWRYPRITDVVIAEDDFTGDGTTDLLVKSRENADTENVFDEGSSRVIFVVDGATRKMAWTYSVPQDVLSDTGALYKVQTAPDVNGDGKADVVGYLQHYGDWNKGDAFGEKTRLMVFSGKDGRILLDKSVPEEEYYGVYDELFSDPIFLNESIRNAMLKERGMEENHYQSMDLESKRQFDSELSSRIKDILRQQNELKIRKRIHSLDIINDMSGDGIDDFILGCDNDVFVASSTSGDVVWNRTINGYPYRGPFGGEEEIDFLINWTDEGRSSYLVVGDSNGDGIDDMVCVNWNEILYLHSEKTGSRVDYVPEFSTKFKDGIDESKVAKVGDLNGNGASDIVVEVNQKDASPLYRFLDGRNGYVILEAERSGTGVDLHAGDLNGNGFDDFITFQMWSDEGGPKLRVIDGRTGETVMTYDGIDESWPIRDILGYQTVMPASNAGDINGDGVDDLAIVRSQEWNTGAEVVLYDVKNGEEISTVTLEDMDRTIGSEERWMPGIMAEKLSDVNGDGHEELGVIAAVGEEHRKEVKMFIVDAVNNEIISDFSSVGKDILDLGEDKVGIVGSSGNIYFLDIKKDLRITSPASGAVVGSPVMVEWTGASDAVSLVLVDSQRTVQTDDSSTEFEIISGDHKITVYSFDRYGKGVYDTIDVSVRKSSASTMVAAIIVLILLGMLFSPKLISFIMGASK